MDVHQRCHTLFTPATSFAFHYTTSLYLTHVFAAEGAEACGSTEMNMRRALNTLKGVHGHTDRWSQRSIHEVARNEKVCQRSVSSVTRLGRLPWDSSRAGPHLHRNYSEPASVLLPALRPRGGVHSSRSAPALTSKRRPVSEQGQARPLRTPAKRGSVNILGHRVQSPAFTPLQEPALSGEAGSVASKFSPHR